MTQNDASGALKNYLPYKLITVDDQLQLHWLNTFGMPFTEPFFNETILKCLSARTTGNFKPVSDLQMVNYWAAELPPVEPSAIIFHISRCGSTLVSQLLATLSRHIVLSEVPVFDDILRLQLQQAAFDEQTTSTLLTSVLKFYGVNKTGETQSDLFIKTDCWHLFFYEQLRRLYPGTPFIIIYRSPDAVFRSHSKMPGMHTIRHMIEPALFGFEAGSAAFESQETYLATVIERYLEKSLEIAEVDNNTLLLNYSEGPMAMIKQTAAFTGISLSTPELANMEERSRYHSKKPEEQFSEEPVINVPPALGAAINAYQKLDKKRLSTIGF